MGRGIDPDVLLAFLPKVNFKKRSRGESEYGVLLSPLRSSMPGVPPPHPTPPHPTPPYPYPLEKQQPWKKSCVTECCALEVAATIATVGLQNWLDVVVQPDVLRYERTSHPCTLTFSQYHSYFKVSCYVSISTSWVKLGLVCPRRSCMRAKWDLLARWSCR